MNTKKVTKVQQPARARGRDSSKRPRSKRPTKPVGRRLRHKAVYSAELRELICDRIVDGATWRELEQEGVVSQRTVATWLKTIPEFSNAYLWAREARAETIMGEIENLIKSLNSVEDHVTLQAIKLEIDTRKWQVSCYYPRVYGTRTIVETEAVKPIDTYDYSRLTESELKTLLALMEKALVSQAEPS